MIKLNQKQKKWLIAGVVILFILWFLKAPRSNFDACYARCMERFDNKTQFCEADTRTSIQKQLDEQSNITREPKCFDTRGMCVNTCAGTK